MTAVAGMPAAPPHSVTLRDLDPLSLFLERQICLETE